MFEIYKGKKVLVTGPCGFKSSWLIRWLGKLGCETIGYGHSSRTTPSHFSLLYPFYHPLSEDLLEFKNLRGVINDFKPDIVFHLAAKAIVARTFHEPRETFENNVMGTVNLLEACRQQPSIKGIVMITSDKVYENEEWNYAYREIDKLGGDDPYSASKVCIEHVINCYRKSYDMNIATARAGNVIGGGDYGEKRLIPDIARSTSNNEEVVIHTPDATRPFQHVMEPLYGYLLLGQKILQDKNVNRAWNFGPKDGSLSVLEVLQIAQKVWPQIKWRIDNTPTHKFMVYLLKIDSIESKKQLGWETIWSMERAVTEAVRWYKEYYQNGCIITDQQLENYITERQQHNEKNSIDSE
jgi:CDP-glucose 4,6-dehydratase